MSPIPSQAAVLTRNDTALRFGVLAKTTIPATVKGGATNDQKNIASILVRWEKRQRPV